MIRVNTAIGRYYNGKHGLVPSVNTVLSVLNNPFIKQWAIKGSVNAAINLMNADTRDTDRIFREAANWSENYKNYAMSIGSTVHKMIEDWIRAGSYDYQASLSLVKTITEQEVRNAFGAFLSWSLDVEPKYAACELIGESQLGYAGTCDAIVDIDGTRYLVDFKTSNRLQDSYVIQVAAYRRMFNECGWNIQYGALLRLDKKKGKYQWKPISAEEDASAFARFECLLKYWLLTYGDRREHLSKQ